MTRFTFITILLMSSVTVQAETLIALGSDWKFLDDGSDQGTAWRASSFDDTLWSTGTAQLGYGGNGEETTIDDGGDSTNRHITYYFRRTFTVADASAVIGLNLGIVDDDGSVIYINGSEVGRNNMPAGAIDYTTRASSGGTSETALHSFTPDPALLVDGDNVIAVEVHQVSPTSSDVSFDLQLLTSDAPPPPPGIERGPYLHVGTPTSIIVRWRSEVAESSEVRFGTSSDNLNQVVNSAALNTEHEIALSGLSPDTRYYYSIGPIGTARRSPVDGLSFKTSPVTGSQSPVRIWAIGDAGTANSDQAEVYAAYQSYAGSDYTNVFMMLGDNAYNNGTDTQYQAAVFDMYPEMLASSSLWSTRGNHDDIHSGADNDYYDIFTFPTNGEAGGVASGTEAYYSFDVANVHFICLDSDGSDRSVGSAMYNWCSSDLEQNLQPWTVVFFHHPPYTKGSHNSDSESTLIQMRENFLPLLESYGVDLVLTGHSHSYERSYLIDGHYGNSDSFNGATHGKDLGDGNPSGDGSYAKPTFGPEGNEGAVYICAGSSGKLSGTQGGSSTGGGWPHEAMSYYAVDLGSLVIDVTGNVMDVRFLRETGAINDYFQIIKGTGADRIITIGSGIGGPPWVIVDPASAPSGTAVGDQTQFSGLDANADHVLAPLGGSN